MAEYQPGKCNINQVERKKRRVMGAVSFLNALLLVTVIYLFPSFTPLYIAIFLLGSTGFLGFLQSQKRFCTGLALKKKFKTNNSTEKVSEKEHVSKDRRKAAKIILQSLIMASLFTALVFLLANI